MAFVDGDYQITFEDLDLSFKTPSLQLQKKRIWRHVMEQSSAKAQKNIETSVVEAWQMKIV